MHLFCFTAEHLVDFSNTVFSVTLDNDDIPAPRKRGTPAPYLTMTVYKEAKEMLHDPGRIMIFYYRFRHCSDRCIGRSELRTLCCSVKQESMLIPARSDYISIVTPELHGFMLVLEFL